MIIEMVEKGIPVFPIFSVDRIDRDVCTCGDANCASPGKHPRTPRGFHDAAHDLRKVEEWLIRWPRANWAIPTGAVSGIVVVDLDPRHGGEESWFELQKKHDQYLKADTPEVWTGGGGRHIWFAYEDPISCSIGKIAQGIDIRGDGGYVLIPPSNHVIGEYRWKINIGEVELQTLPRFILEHVESSAETVRSDSNAILEGSRNSVLASLAGTMRRRGMSERAILTALEVENRVKCSPPLPITEVHAIASSISKYEPEKHAIPAIKFHMTDLGNAERLVNKYGDRIRFNHDMGGWYVWDERRWMPDSTANVRRFAQDTVRSLQQSTISAAEEENTRALTKHAIKSEARSRLEAMVSIGEALLPILNDDLDRHPMLLNVRNGTLDLTIGDLQRHRSSDYLTKLIDVDYVPTANCPNWDEFLHLLSGSDKALIDYLQIAVGYSLSGRTDEQCLFFVYGTGQNGKTTFIETIYQLLGDYGHRVDIGALLKHWRHSSNPTPYIASLQGKRFAVSSEIPEGRKLNEALIKDITGGDTVTARYLHKNPFTFQPTHKLWLSGNYKPLIRGTDLGIWRRLKIIPFQTTIPRRIQRPMHEVLEDFEMEKEGILAWAVEGCLRWQNHGLPSSDVVERASKDYRQEQDVTQQFLDENCEKRPSYSIRKETLYRAFIKWCEESGEMDSMGRSKRWFTHQLQKRGIELGGKGRRDYHGIQQKVD